MTGRTRGTVRLRMTLLYSGLFLASAAVLLVVVNLLLRNMLNNRLADIEREAPLTPLPALPSASPGPTPGPAPQPSPTQHTSSGQIANDLSDAVQRFQWGVTAATIVALAIISVVAGWWLAGRLLRPLHGITATARRLSLADLDQRIGLMGPKDELKELADTFDDMLARLERSALAQRRFIGNVAHELRTPLATQRAAIQIGLTDDDPDRIATVREQLLDANKRTERIIDSLLVLAHSERGLDATADIALDRVVRQAIDELDASDRVVAANLEPVVVTGDAALLGRLVANLLHNAVRYNHPGGSVEVRTRGSGELVVSNTGPLVPAESVAELFEPFRRLDAARVHSADGVGLGLSIVAAIAAAHGADVQAVPNQDGGLRVSVRLRNRRHSV